jgi:GrpB-like predicted nucleotidyltransferase (UPF0157 family)
MAYFPRYSQIQQQKSGIYMPVTLVTHDATWSQHYEAEGQKILQALGGWAWKGGVVFDLQHIGSTSIPDMVAKPCIDIALNIHPFPLESSFIEALQALGYSYRGENGIAGRQYFQRGPHDVHLHVCNGETTLFSEHVLFRDYLRANLNARKRYETLKLELAQHAISRDVYTEGKAPLIKILLQEAQAWHIQTTGFNAVDWMKKELEFVESAWCVASGWALDLFLNRVTRVHQDFDVCIWRDDQLTFLSYLKSRGWNLQVPVDGKYRPWQEGERLELPLIQVHARRNNTPFEFLDILFMERDAQHWIYRREPRVTMPIEQVTLNARGVKILNPALILLFKSRTADKDPRGKDQADFAAVLPYLAQAHKIWLDTAFDHWMPGHPWRSLLT